MISLGHLVVLLAIVFILFGAKKFPGAMTDLGRGVRNFKKALEENAPDDDKDKSQKIKKR